MTVLFYNILVNKLKILILFKGNIFYKDLKSYVIKVFLKIKTHNNCEMKKILLFIQFCLFEATYFFNKKLLLNFFANEVNYFYSSTLKTFKLLSLTHSTYFFLFKPSTNLIYTHVKQMKN